MVMPTAATPNNNSARKSSQRVALYAGVGPELTHYDLDVDGAGLVKRGSVLLTAGVQYAWPHASRQYFYVASSDRGPGAAAAGSGGGIHHLSAFRVDLASGALQPHGDPVPLSHRPIHMTTDLPSEHALIAYSDPSHLTVHRINRDGTVGDEVKQPGLLDAGIYAHQVRVAPSNTMVILVTRGHDAKPGKPEDPGALKVFKYRDGVLSGEVSIAPGGGFGFGPRHLDFHPSQPWVYVSLERQHKVSLFTLDGDTLSSEPRFSKDTLAEPGNVRRRQLASTVHVHPNGRFVYGAERADATMEVDGKQVFAGGENTIVAYAIDERTGEPTLIQRVATRGLHPRTFAIDPGGRVLIAANKSPMVVKEGNTLRTVPASMDVFRVGTDGKLDFVRKYDIDVGSHSIWWMGLMKL